MNILDFSTTHSEVVDEIINVSDSNPVHLAHDIFYHKSGKFVRIFTAASEGGTELTAGTDFDVGGVFPDGSLPQSISPDVAYTTVEITNATYHDQALYVHYYPIGDIISATRWNVSTLPAGMIAPFGMASAPTGWLACDGSLVDRGTYAALFDAIGETWDAGDGSTTFGLPDLRGAFPRGTGTGTIDTRDKVGPAVGAFQEDQMQGHWHLVNLTSENALQTGTDNRRVTGAEEDTTADNIIRGAVTDTVNGTPRTGTETRPYAAGVLWCIKT